MSRSISRLIIVTSLLFALALSACIHPPFPYTDGPFSGRVFDDETKGGLAGAIVVVLREADYPRMDGGPDIEHARETHTDSNGYFHFDTRFHALVNPFKWLLEPKFAVFKPGYSPFRLGPLPRNNEFTLRRLTSLDELRKYTDAGDVGVSNCGFELKDHVLRWATSNGKCIYDPDVQDLILAFNEHRTALGFKSLFVRLEEQCRIYRGVWNSSKQECKSNTNIAVENIERDV